MFWFSNFTHAVQPFPLHLLHWYTTCLHVFGLHASLEGCAQSEYNTPQIGQNDTYDHRTLKIRLPVRSAIYKQCTGGLVVRWVTTSESPLLYVFAYLFFDATTYITCPSLFRRSACDEYLVERNH
jgi:hypothetical protein